MRMKVAKKGKQKGMHIEKQRYIPENTKINVPEETKNARKRQYIECKMRMKRVIQE